MLIFVLAILGLVCGWLIDWLAGILPRYAVEPPANVPPLRRPGPPALWLALTGHLDGLGLRLALEIGTGLAFGLLAARFGLSVEMLFLAVAWVFFALIALIDLRYRLVLNVIVIPAMAVALLYHILGGPPPLLHTLLGGGLALFIFGGVAWLRPGDLGGGDVKLALLLGLIFGFPGILWALIVGVGAGGAVAVILLARRRGLKASMPYAPFLCLGALIALLYNPIPLIW
jgi:leader peptidase (prepilin peptidase)/N-methyltransferase